MTTADFTSMVASSRSRAGVSLLETMIAMAVALIGLLGVASLLTVAGARLGSASKIDAAAAGANVALGTFRARGFDRDDYVLSDGSRLPPWSPSPSPFSRPAIPLVIDPLGSDAVFPAHGDPAFSVLRVAPGAIGRIADPAERSAVTDSIFRLRDDLVFQRPTDRTLPAQAVRGPSGTIDNDGRFSWMATLSPVDPSSDQYTLSIVVFHQREPADSTTEVGLPVRFLDSGRSGGDVVLRDSAALRIQDGSWLMLRGQGHRLGWYRVVSARQEVLTDRDIAASQSLIPGDEGGRIVSLFGADWPAPENPAEVNTQGTFAKGVTQVIERTMRLKN